MEGSRGLILDKDIDVLCLKDGARLFGIALQDVVELCIQPSIYQIPCLPDYFCGAFHYKGEVVPVVCLDPETKEEQEYLPLLLVVKSSQGLFGIRLKKQPWICTVRPTERVEDFDGKRNLDLWKYQDSYAVEEGILLLLDIEKSAASLTAFKNSRAG
ncbi:MAG: chemotaxis protein CheW [Blautia sp.]|jgi:chemotaxis signal transduction protein